MNTAQNPPSTAQSSDSLPRKCFVCGGPFENRYFCEIHRQNATPVMLCSSKCTLKYLDSTSPAADLSEQELHDCEEHTNLFIGKDKPWPQPEPERAQ